MNIIIAGSRTYENYERLCVAVDEFVAERCGHEEEVVIISDTAKGADQLGELYAKSRKFAIKRFPADWNKYGLSAGHLRNEQMAKVADACIVFWDGKSKGTRSMINLAKKYELISQVEMF